MKKTILIGSLLFTLFTLNNVQAQIKNVLGESCTKVTTKHVVIGNLYGVNLFECQGDKISRLTFTSNEFMTLNVERVLDRFLRDIQYREGIRFKDRIAIKDNTKYEITVVENELKSFIKLNVTLIDNVEI